MSLSFGTTWSEFTRRIFIDAPLVKVFEAWSIQGNMEKWFLKKAQFVDGNDKPRKAGNRIEAGDTYKWQWYTWPEFDQEGEVLEFVNNERIVFTFRPSGDVKLEFREISPERTQFVLKQFNIPTDDVSKKDYFYGCSLGWSFWMVNLKAFLEHGIVLDERDVLFTGNERLEVVNH